MTMVHLAAGLTSATELQLRDLVVVTTHAAADIDTDTAAGRCRQVRGPASQCRRLPCRPFPRDR